MYVCTCVGRSNIFTSKGVLLVHRISPFLVLGRTSKMLGVKFEGISREVVDVSVEALILAKAPSIRFFVLKQCIMWDPGINKKFINCNKSERSLYKVERTWSGGRRASFIVISINLYIGRQIKILAKYRKSENFRIQKFLCKKFSSKKIFGCERLSEN